MPLLAITTSAPPVPAATRAEALARLSAEVARALEKPEAYVMIAVAPPATMLFGGAPEPALYAELKNVGTLAPGRVAALSALLCGALGAAFGVAKERIYIEFTNADGALWGWNGETFAD